MYAVFRQTRYAEGEPIRDTPQYRAFHRAHADQPGYVGTTVAAVGGGRLLTVTLWRTEHDMQAAQAALGPMIGQLLEPLMTAPSILLGTGPVLVGDLVGVDAGSELTGPV